MSDLIGRGVATSDLIGSSLAAAAGASSLAAAELLSLLESLSLLPHAAENNDNAASRVTILIHRLNTVFIPSTSVYQRRSVPRTLAVQTDRRRR